MIGISEFCGTYLICHDGWNGTLYVAPAEVAGSEAVATYADSTGREYPVKISVSDYHITLYIIGLGGQNADGTGGQKFQGYLMTQTKDAIAGTTWWQDRPFGFYAVKT